MFSRSGDPEATPRPHLHQPKPEHPFNYAKAQEAAQEARDREAKLLAERADAEAEKRHADMVAAREAAQHAESMARIEHERLDNQMSRREFFETFADSETRHNLQAYFDKRDKQVQAKLLQMRGELGAYDRAQGLGAAYARLGQPLTASNIQDKDGIGWDNVLSAADMGVRGKRDTFSTESFGFHADGKPIVSPHTPAPPSPQPATEIKERAAHAETISDVSLQCTAALTFRKQ